VGLGFVAAPDERTERFLGSDALAAALRRLQVEPGDFVFVPSGEIHYIGPGVLLFEIQQCSDLTYRIQDWGREGRETHLQKAARALRWEGRRGEELLWRGDPRPSFGASCPFELELVELAGRAELHAQERPLLFFPLAGRGVMEHGAERWELLPHRCWLLPAGTEACLETEGDVTGLLCAPGKGCAGGPPEAGALAPGGRESR
jgi:mannose-6-phosphate isomerase class I